MEYYNNCSTDINNILFNVPLNSTDTYDLSTNTYNSLKLNDSKEHSTSQYSIYKNMVELKTLYDENNTTLMEPIGNNHDNLQELFDELIHYEDNTSHESKNSV
jgi:hypothetical protein